MAPRGPGLKGHLKVNPYLKRELTLKKSLGPQEAVRNRLCPKQVENNYSGQKVA